MAIATSAAFCYLSALWHPQEEAYYQKLGECLKREIDFQPKYHEQTYYFGLSFFLQQFIVSYFMFSAQKTHNLKNSLSAFKTLVLFATLFACYHIVVWHGY